MVGSDGIRGYTDLMILCLLLEKDSYGYEISMDIRERTNEAYVMKETTLYSAFTRMEKSGLITPYPGEKSHGRKRTYYRMTQKGKDYYWEKCGEWKMMQKIVEQFVKEEEQ